MRIPALLALAALSTGCAGLLNKGRSSMVIDSEPGAARVLVNGNERGATPFIYAYDPSDGESVTFELRLPGYQAGTMTVRPERSNGVLFLDAMFLQVPYIADRNSPALYRMPTSEFRVRMFKELPADMQRQMVPVSLVDVGIGQNAEMGTLERKPIRNGKDPLFKDVANSDQLASMVVSGLKDTWMDARFVRQGTTKGDESVQRAKLFLRPKLKAVQATLTGSRNKCYGLVELEVEWCFYSGQRTDSLLFSETTRSTYHALGEHGGDLVSEAMKQAARLFAEDLTVASRVAGHYGSGLQQTKGEPVQLVPPKPIPYTGRREMLAALVKAVVTISTEKGHGSGFLVSNDGYLITNEHVVGKESLVKVKFEQGFTLDAQVVKVNKDFDLALLKVQASDLPALTVGNDAGLMLGEEIFAIGTPLDANLGQSVSRGVLSGRRELDGRTYLQTDVSINPGNSGGPFIDENGTVVGVATMKISGKGLEGLGFGVPISVALEMLNLSIR